MRDPSVGVSGWWLSASLLQVAAGGCTQATFDAAYGADAGQVSALSVCEDWPGGEGLPEGASSLAGQYALTTHHFDLAPTAELWGVKLQTQVTTRTDMLAQVAERDGELQLELRICDWERVYTTLGGLRVATAKVDHVEHAPVRRLSLALGPGCAWAAARSTPITWGYGAKAADPCGQDCRCSDDGDSLPQVPEDCRVVDADFDGQPGFSAHIVTEAVSLEASALVHRLALRNHSAFIQGRLGEQGRHTALEQRKEEIAHLGCASLLSSVPCGDHTSQVVLERLEPGEVTMESPCEPIQRRRWQQAPVEFPLAACAALNPTEAPGE